MLTKSCAEYSGEQLVQQVSSPITYDFIIQEDGEYIFTITNQYAVSKKYELEPYVSNLKGTILVGEQLNTISKIEDGDTSAQKVIRELFSLENEFTGSSGEWFSDSEFTLNNKANISISVEMAAKKGSICFYIKSLEDGRTQYIHNGNGNFTIKALPLDAGKYQAVIKGENLWEVNYKVTGNLLQQSTPDQAKDPIPIKIETIGPDNLVCIGKYIWIKIPNTDVK